MADITLRMTGVQKGYRQNDGSHQEVLRGLDLTLHRGETLALIAPSGAGKSTLLNIAGLMTGADSGRIEIEGQLCTPADRLIRGRSIGFVFQFHYLLAEFTALENIMMPAKYHRTADNSAIEDAALALLEEFGISHRAEARPAQMSGGEKQRVAICRALIHAPSLLIADEPTGSLDPSSAEIVTEALLRRAREENLSVLMATHNHELAARLGSVVRLRAGKIAEATW